jgi:ribonucleoside-diphosphate reductase alpha chain
MNLNLALFDEWKHHLQFIEDVIHAMDNVAEMFILTANPQTMKRAIYSATRERALAMGVIGFHSYLQKNMIPFESPMAKGINLRIFSHIHKEAVAASIKLGTIYGECPDMIGTGRRNSHLIAHAPTASTSQILGESPSIEPIRSNGYTQRTQAGTNVVKNKYLKDVLAKIGQDTKDVWDSIFNAEGSVQHLSFLDEWTKDVFKTAFEIDQHYVVQHAIDRYPWVCQAQSLNLFFPAVVSIEYLHSVHWKAMTQGCKTLYYLRSRAASSGESSSLVQVKSVKNFVTDPTECLFCQ